MGMSVLLEFIDADPQDLYAFVQEAIGKRGIPDVTYDTTREVRFGDSFFSGIAEEAVCFVARDARHEGGSWHIPSAHTCTCPRRSVGSTASR